MTNKNQFNADNVRQQGKHLLALHNTAKTATDTKKTTANDFNWLVLKTLIEGTIQDIQSVAAAFAKGGELHELRMYLSRSKAVVSALNTAPITIVNKKEKTSSMFTLEQVKASEQALFNVSSAYNSLVKPEVIVSPEEAAIQAFLEANNMTKAEFKTTCDIRPDYKQTAITQGQVILEDIAKNEAQKAIPGLSETIREYALQLKALDNKAFSDLLASLNNLESVNGERKAA